jgi:aminoglycoside phosphotransferase (APT) family kinase protein
MQKMTESLAETAVALALALSADARFPSLAARLTGASGPFAVLHWVRGIAAAVEEGIMVVNNDNTVDDVDFLATIDRVANYLLDRALAPGGTIPSGEPLTNFTIWAAHQR